MQSCRGISTLEALVSLSIALPTLLVFGAGFRELRVTSNIIEIERSKTYAELRLQSQLRQILNDLDTFRFEIPPRIHHNGQFKLSDGTESALTKLHSPLKADVHSSAISAIRVSLDKTFKVIEQQTSFSEEVIFACPRYNYTGDLSEERSFLGFSVDGVVSLVGRATPHRGRKGCKDFLLMRSKSMTVPPNSRASEKNLALIVPIEREYTLYLSQQGELRYVGHRGEEIIENQPIVSNVNNLSLSLERDAHLGLYSLKALYSLKTEKSKQLQLSNVLGRNSYLPWVMNSP